MNENLLIVDYIHTLRKLNIEQASEDVNKNSLGVVLVVLPHRDDELGYGYDLIKEFKSKNYNVIFIYETEGENGKIYEEDKPEELVRETRAKEGISAMNYYGTSSITLDHGDGVLYRHQHELVDNLSALVRVAQPDYVVTIHREEITPIIDHAMDHPGLATVIAAEQADTLRTPSNTPPAKKRPTLIEITTNPLKANRYLNVSFTSSDEKVKVAKEIYPSQFAHIPNDDLRIMFESLVRPPNGDGLAREYYHVIDWKKI